MYCNFAIDRGNLVQLLIQVGEVCHSNDGMTCSNDSILTSLHLTLISQMLNVRAEIDRCDYNCCHYTMLLTVVYFNVLSLLILSFPQDECFTFLRTINKLGYVVFCFNGNNENIGSFQVLVQSEAFDGEYVYDKITEFLEDHVFSTVLDQTNLTRFTQFVNGQKIVLKSVLEQKEPTLDQRTTRLWNKIEHGQLTFDLVEQQVQLLDSNLINATSVMDFYQEYILNPTTHRKMIIVVNGKDRDFQPDVTYPLPYAQLPDSYPAI